MPDDWHKQSTISVNRTADVYVFTKAQHATCRKHALWECVTLEIN